MKILHICLAAFYIDNYSYQENMLPKYHKKLGYDVSILASLQSFDEHGNASFLDKESEYINEYGIPVKRIKYKNYFKAIVRKFKIYNNIYNHIDKIKPDIIFIHGCQFFNMKDIRKYAENNPNVRIFVDNHCDFSNSATNWFSKNILHKIFWRHSARLIEPFTEKFYGVLPARVDFIIDMYKISSNKVELLVMGSDDERVEEVLQEDIKNNIRKKYDIKHDDFLVVTGGKIDAFKRQTLLLMKAIKKLNNNRIKLLVFGSITEDLKKEVEELVDGENIKYIGWISSYKSYDIFAASDLAVFPGRHSVFWEQVTGIGVPMIVKYWTGTTHIDLQGNCEYLYKDSVDEIENVLSSIINDKEKYGEMRRVAVEKGMKEFSYLTIAKKSIGIKEEKKLK